MKHKLLVAEDDASSAELMRVLLERWGMDSHGFRLVGAVDGFEAWDFVKRAKNVAMAVVDVIMPGMDGFELIGNIRRRETERHEDRMCIVVLTAVAGAAAEAAVAGADFFMTKPYCFEQLAGILAGVSHGFLAEADEECDFCGRRAPSPVFSDGYMCCSPECRGMMSQKVVAARARGFRKV